MRRPLLLGTDNPHSSDPRAALLPRPRGGAGHRLFVMSRMTWREYRNAFERRNSCDVTLEDLRDRTVVVLGRETWRRTRPLLGASAPRVLDMFDRYFTGSSIFLMVPHPSGRNLWYNESRNRHRVTRLLRRLSRAGPITSRT